MKFQIAINPIKKGAEKEKKKDIKQFAEYI